MRVIWNDDKGTTDTRMSISPFHHHAYKEAGDNYLDEVDVARQGYVVRRDIRNTTPASVFERFYGTLPIIGR